MVRSCVVDTSADVWIYVSESHKTEHHGRQRVIPIGPQSQEVLRPYLLRDSQAYCFAPVDGERKRRREQHAQRKTPISYGNRPGTNRKRKPNCTGGESYKEGSYHRACDEAFPAPEPARTTRNGNLEAMARALNGKAAA